LRLKTKSFRVFKLFTNSIIKKIKGLKRYDYLKIILLLVVLVFALYKNMGELVLCKSIIRKELKKFNKTFEQLLGFLVIHGMLHLK